MVYVYISTCSVIFCKKKIHGSVIYDRCTIPSCIMPYFLHTGIIGERITETLLLLWTRASSRTPSNWLLARGYPTAAPIMFHALWLWAAEATKQYL